jgi:CP family cyanate transporter-like MFS transporter
VTRTQRHAGTVLAIVLLGINLRTIFSSLPPLVGDVRDDLGLSAFAAGLLTTLPVLCLGALAPLAPRLSSVVPVERLLCACALLTAVGCGMRGAGGVAGLYAGTLLAGAAIAIAQTLVPVFVRSVHPDNVGELTGAFSMSLPLGAALGSAFAVPLADALGGWDASLAVWALPALVAFLVWLPAARRAGTRVATHPWGAVLRDPVAWSVALLFGVQSAAFYAGLSWLPSILQDDGYSKGVAGTLQAGANLMQVIPAFLLPILAGRRRSQGGLLAGVTVVQVVAVAGLLAAPGAAVLWMAVLGIGQGAVLGLALILPVLRGGDVGTVASLTAMTLCVGYLVASTGPWVLGLAHDLSGSWTLPLVIMLVLSAAQLPVGWRAAQNRVVGRVRAPA